MKLPTRLRILDLLRKLRAASALTISRALGMTRANIRHHLVVLESNDLVEVVGQHRSGRGRPENIYGLSRRVLGDGLDQLSSALLAEWLGGLGAREREARLRSLAERISGSAEVKSGETFPKRLSETMQRLNQLHYQARWEAGDTGPRVILGHCPFLAIIEGHPELCTMDAHLLANYLARPVTQLSKLERQAQGLPQCIFVVS